MSLKHEFNRITHFLDDRVGETEKQANQWLNQGARQAEHLKRRVRHQVNTGRQKAISVEESLLHHAREKPSIYIIGAVLLIGVLVARLVFEIRRTPSAPLL
jgi:hypothetical protein